MASFESNFELVKRIVGCDNNTAALPAAILTAAEISASKECCENKAKPYIKPKVVKNADIIKSTFDPQKR